MSGFFNSENWFWRGFGRIADYFILSTMWMICCVPLVTAGSASIALYDTVAHCIRSNDDSLARRFFGTFKKELLRGAVLTVIWAVVGFLLNMGYQIVCQLGWTMFSAVYFATLFVPLGIVCWGVALESRFTYRIGELHKTAVAFTFAHLPHTAAIVAILILVLNVVLNFPFFLIFLPAAMAHLQSVFIEKVFAKYMPVEGSTEIE